MFFRNRCYNGGLRHNFKARYSVRSKFPSGYTAKNVFADEIEAFKDREEEYIHDVCVWCGKVIKRTATEVED